MEAAIGLVDLAIKLFNLLDESYQQGKGLTADIDFIKKELRSIKEAIGMRSGSADQDGIRSWMADLRDICRKIENCIELYNLKVTGNKKKHDVIHHIKTKSARTKLSDDIDAIRKLVEQANARVNWYHPQAQQAAAAGASGRQIMTIQNSYINGAAAPRHANEANPDGLDTPKAELVRLLSQGDGKAKQLRVIAIDGLGGSGKTVLAKSSYEQVNGEFDCSAWVSASDDVDDLLTDILREFREQIPQSSEDLGRRIRDFLQNKRYIIVIDNVHTTVWWRDVLYACPDNNMSSRIIVTTANEQIARNCHMNCRIQKMQPLDQISARALLTRKAFGEGGCPTNWEEVLGMILETCECLPLAIVNMADHIKGIRVCHTNECVQACENLRFLLDAKNEAFLGMNQVLNRSYSNLNNNTMACLLSLTMYHKHNFFKRKSLIRRWMAEKLIMVTNGQSAEAVANQCFSDLVDHNIILPVHVSINGQVKRFRVHRIMLEFIMNRAHSDNHVTWIHIPNDGMKDRVGGDNIHRLYLHNESSRPPKIWENIDLSYVRSLTFFGQATKSLMDFRDYKLLTSLDLEGCRDLQDEHLELVCKSSILVYLSIRGNPGVTKIPRKIVKLKRLETMDTRGTSVGTLPIEVIQLPELTNLFGEFQITYSSSSMRAFLSEKICKLQTLAGFYLDEGPCSFVKALPRMTRLNKIKIICREGYAPSKEAISDLLASLEECFERDLSPPNLPLRSLSIDFGPSGDLDFLYELEVALPCSLRSLKLRGNLRRLPKFIESAPNLQELCLSGNNLGWDDVLPRLQRLQNLLYLKLTELDTFRCGAEGLIWRSGGFVSLKRLCFVVPELPNIVIQNKAMPGLESLQLFCFRLGAISGIEHLLRLEEVIVASNFRGVAAEDLKRQVEVHPVRPKFRKEPHPSPPASRPELTRSKRIQRNGDDHD
uniref:NB-ARC domain-containing protein n=1 Tax=Leersia perrieri TaxID=77586 RepID=A0A0D9XU64_9ORYZ